MRSRNARAVTNGTTPVGLLARAVLVSALAGLVAGCDQQAGERCEIDSDCASGLICDPGAPTKTCVLSASMPNTPIPDAGPSIPDVATEAAPAETIAPAEPAAEPAPEAGVPDARDAGNGSDANGVGDAASDVRG